MSGSTLNESPTPPDVVPGGARVGRTVSPRLIGRADEVAQAVVALTRLPAVVVIEGEAGIGKTRLLAELRSRPELDGLRFVTGACRRIRDPFPLGAVVDALRTQADQIHADRLTPVAGALRPLLPELGDLLPPRPEPLDDRIGERHRVFRGLVEVLHGLDPVVLVVEDLHWADEQTVDFVRYLLDDPPPGLAVLTTYRGEECTAEMRGLTSTLPPSTSRAHLVLEPLDVAETGALGAAILDTDRLTEEFAAKLCERSSGLPFAIEELLALLRARGTLVRHDDGWARRRIDELEVPVGIRASVLERAGRLPADARAVLEAAAVLQSPVPLRVLVEVCPVHPHRVSGGLDAALASGLLVERDNAVGFRHVLAAQAVYENLTLPRRVELHGRAAGALQRERPVPLGQLAHHLHQAGREEEWALAAERAAGQALELGHEDEAVRLLREVLDEAHLEPEHRGRLAVLLGLAAMESSQCATVFDVLSAVLDEDGERLPRPVRGELRFWMAMFLHVTGQDPAREYRLGGESVPDLSRPDLRTWAMILLANPHAPGVAMAEHLAWLQRARASLEEIADPTLQVFLRSKIAMISALAGDHRWRDLTARMDELTGTVPRNRREVNAYWSVSLAACYSGHQQTAAALLATGRAGVAHCGSPRPGLYIQHAQVVVDYCTGAWARVDDDLASLFNQLRDDGLMRLDATVVAGCLELARGNLDAAYEWLAVRLPESAPIDGDLLPLRTAALVRLALARDNIEAAAATAKRFLVRLEAKPIWPPAVRALPPMTDAMVAAGRVADAHALVDRFDTAVRGLDAPLAPAALAHARGYLALSADDPRAAAARFLTAAELYEPARCVYEAAQAREQAARCLFEFDDSRAAGALLAAISTYEGLGAAWDLRRAAGLARARGVRLPGRHRGGSHGYGAELSPREREVAELAAIGRSNQDIADHLYLSISTVKKHLAAAMRKLDVSSRTALAHLLSGGGHPGADFENGTFGP